MAYCLVFQGTSINTAVGIGQLPAVASILSDLLNGYCKDAGLPNGPQYGALAVHAFIAYACLTNASYADIAINICSAWCLVNGVTLGLATTPALKQWGMENADTLTTALAKQAGFFLLGLGALVYSLSQGNVDSIRAIGYSWIPLLVNLVDMAFVSKEFVELNMPMGPIYTWIVLMAVFVGTLAFE